MKRKMNFKKSGTLRGDSLQKYLDEISKNEFLSVEEEIELGIRIKRGDEGAINELCESNLLFVVKVAKQYQNLGLSLHDLISEGNLGLIEAAKRFDVNLGCRFVTPAYWWISQSIHLALTETSRTVRLPTYKIEEKKAIKDFSLSFEQLNEREPSPYEVAETFDLSVRKVNEALNGLGHCFPLDSPLNESFEGNLLETIINEHSPNPEHLLNLESLSFHIRKILKVLSDDEREMIRLYHGIGEERAKNINEIATQLKTTRLRVSKKIKEAIEKLKKVEEVKILKQYCG